MSKGLFCLPDPSRIKKMMSFARSHIAERRLQALQSYEYLHALSLARGDLFYAFEQLDHEHYSQESALYNPFKGQHVLDVYDLDAFLQADSPNVFALKGLTHLYKNPVAALAAVLSIKSVLLVIPPNSITTAPLKLHLHDTLSFEELTIVVGKGAHVVIEDDLAALAKRFYARSIRVYLHEGAQVSWLYHQQTKQETLSLLSYTFFLQKQSELSLGIALAPGGNVTLLADIVLQGDQAKAECGGFYLLQGQQQSNIIVRQEHEVPHTHSSCIINGSVADRARIRYQGTIHIPLQADYSTAKQVNKTVLQSNEARATSLPQLEAYAPHISCQHGSAVGQVLDESLSYLQSRGICPEHGRKLITQAILFQGCPSNPFLAQRLSDLMKVYW